MIKWENKALIHSLNLGILVVRHCRNHSGVAFISVKLESYDGIYYFLEYSHDQLVSFFSLATRTDHLLKNRPYYKVLFVLSYPVAFFFFLIIWLFRVLVVACGIYLVLQPGNEPQAPCIGNPEDLLPGPPGKCPHLFLIMQIHTAWEPLWCLDCYLSGTQLFIHWLLILSASTLDIADRIKIKARKSNRGMILC